MMPTATCQYCGFRNGAFAVKHNFHQLLPRSQLRLADQVRSSSMHAHSKLEGQRTSDFLP